MEKANDSIKKCDAIKTVLKLAFNPAKRFKEAWGMVIVILSIIASPILNKIFAFFDSDFFISLGWRLFIVFFILTGLFFNAAYQIQMKFKSEEEKLQKKQQHKEWIKEKLMILNSIHDNALPLLHKLRKHPNDFNESSIGEISKWQKDVEAVYIEMGKEVDFGRWKRAVELEPYKIDESGTLIKNITGTLSTSAEELKANMDYAAFLRKQMDALDSDIKRFSEMHGIGLQSIDEVHT